LVAPWGYLERGSLPVGRCTILREIHIRKEREPSAAVPTEDKSKKGFGGKKKKKIPRGHMLSTWTTSLI